MEVPIDQDGVWDDSALVDSWNEALQEYNKYHSIKAKGGTVEDIEGELKAVRAKWDAKPEQETEDAGEPINMEVEQESSVMDGVSTSKSDETPLAKEEPSTTPNHNVTTVSEEDQKQQQGTAPQPPLPAPAADPRAAAFGPQTVLGTVQDEGLKKVLLAWYYAGYYTGLMEGQQQSQQKPSEG
ncbi:hypothetical protein V8F06_006903 [Rhypophila decipiens]